MLLQSLVLGIVRLPEDAPFGESILLECLRRRAFPVAAVIAVSGLLLWFRPRLRHRWDQLEGGVSLRYLVGALASALAWAGSAYAFNAWYGQPHLVDRLALVLLAGLVFWRPAFALPFVAAFWAVVWQFNAPPLGFEILVAEFTPVVNALTLFSAAILVRAVIGGRTMNDFVFLTLCLVAANFWVPGYAKWRIDWLTHGHAYYLLPNAYTHGWLAFLEPQTVASATRILAAVDWPARIVTLSVELAALFLLLSARTARALLWLFTILLCGFFLTLGYFFWKWMLLQVALWIVLFRNPDPAGAAWQRDLFTRGRFAVSLVVIGAASIWWAPARLAWFDTPVADTLRYEAVGISGAVRDLPPRFFAPYDSHVAMAFFAASLIPGPGLVSSYGVTADSGVANALAAARSPEDVRQLEGTIGHTRDIDERFAREFDEFVQRTVAVANRNAAANRDGARWLRLVRPPTFIWTFSRGEPGDRPEPIAAVRAYRVSSFFDGTTYTLFRRDLVRTIHIRP